MEIIEKIGAVRKFIFENQDNAQGRDRAFQLQSLAAKAIAKGLGSGDWENYMQIFEPDELELKRLMGQDSIVNETWGTEALTYIAANGICTMDSYGNTTRSMTPQMKVGLNRPADNPIV